jgi:integrase
MPAARMTVSDAATRWLEGYVKTARNEKGMKLAEQRVKDFLVPKLGYVQLQKVTPDSVRHYRVWLEGKNLKPQTIAHVLSDCRCLFNWAEDSGFIQKSPVPRKLLPRIQERPPDRLTDKAAKAVSSLPYPWGFVCRFGLATGLRWSELCRAKVSDVENGSLVVHRTKSGKVRRVPIPQDFLVELRERVGLIVPFSGKSSGAFTRAVRKKSGVRDFHPHQLRHTMACRWLERGGSLAALQLILGHSSIVTTQRYARVSDDLVRREAERLDTGKVTEKKPVEVSPMVAVSS